MTSNGQELRTLKCLDFHWIRKYSTGETKTKTKTKTLNGQEYALKNAKEMFLKDKSLV